MNLKAYLADREGKSIISTADAEGIVGSALYSKPHVFDDGSVAFVMRRKSTYRNLGFNPHASYMFIEDGPGYRGIRLSLKKTGESADDALIESMKRPNITREEDDAKGPKFLLLFSVEKILPLIGDGDAGISPR